MSHDEKHSVKIFSLSVKKCGRMHSQETDISIDIRWDGHTERKDKANMLCLSQCIKIRSTKSRMLLRMVNEHPS